MYSNWFAVNGNWVCLSLLVAGLVDWVAAGNNTITDEVFFDIKIEGRGRNKDSEKGRIVVGVFGDALPMTAWNFVTLAKGFRHVNSQHLWTYKNSRVHRIIPDFLIQTGDVVHQDGRGGRAVYAPFFIDENFYHSHRAGGFVAMANQGFDTNGSQFYITLNRARWLDGKNVVFGKVVQGFDFVTKLAELEVNDRSSPVQKVTIVDSGVLPLKKPYDLSEDQLSSEKDVKRGPSAP